jgi:hypothetical protein
MSRVKIKKPSRSEGFFNTNRETPPASAFGDRIRGADVGASAAGNAGIRVDLVLVRAFGYRADRALGFAGTALDARIGNLVCHG